MPDDILTALGRTLRDQEHTHAPACLRFGTDICVKSKVLPIKRNRGLGKAGTR